jgi:hypothetical protein
MATRTAVVPLRSFKMSWVMTPERLPRDVLPPEGEPGEVEFTLQLENGAPPIKATFNARNYRRMLKEVDADPHGVMLSLQGYLTGGPNGLFLEKAASASSAGCRARRALRAAAPGPAPRGPAGDRARAARAATQHARSGRPVGAPAQVRRPPAGRRLPG